VRVPIAIMVAISAGIPFATENDTWATAIVQRGFLRLRDLWRFLAGSQVINDAPPDGEIDDQLVMLGIPTQAFEAPSGKGVKGGGQRHLGVGRNIPQNRAIS